MEEGTDIRTILAQGGIGVIATDTLYGVVGHALEPETVERIYELKLRDPEKPFIVLIPDIDALEQFGVVLTDELRTTLSEHWPGPVSIVLRCPDEQFSYLHRDKYTLGFRVPDDRELRTLLRDVGPLVAPSANVSGRTPATNCTEAQEFFGSDIDFCVDREQHTGRQSQLIDLTGERPIVLR